MIRNRVFEPVVNKKNLIREVEKHRLKDERLLRLKRFFSVFTKAKQSQGHLRHKEYLYFLTLLQMPLHYIMFLFDLVLLYGAALVVGVYTILLVEIGLPVFMLFIFMGSYCRKGYIRYWECIPLLKGAGYTIALMTIAPEFVNTTSAGVSLLYITDMFHVKIPWSDCKFERATNTCVPMNYRSPNDTIEDANCSTSSPMFSALNYFRFNKLNQYPTAYYEKLGPIKSDWAIAIAITWVLLFLFMVQGFRNFQRIMRILQYCAACCWLVIFLRTLNCGGRYRKKSALFYGIDPALNIQFWLQIFKHICDRNDAGNAILLSSFGVKMAMPKTDAVIVYTYKMVVFALLMFWVPILLQDILNHYSYAESGCFKLKGSEIVFAVIPDVLSRFAFPQLWIILWFLCVYIHGFASALYTFTGAIDSLTDAFPILLIYRTHMCALLCVASITINMLFTTRLSLVLFHTWGHYGMVIVRMAVLAIVTFALTFIYSITRLANDYHFAYGEPIGKFWIRSWKIAPFLVLFETVFILYYHGNDKSLLDTPATFILISYISAMIMLLPIFIVMLWRYCKHVKYQMVSSVLSPEESWGYFIEAKRISRKHFHPEREVRYKISRLKCKHQCLQNSRRFRRLQQTHIVRKNSILTDMNKDD